MRKKTINTFEGGIDQDTDKKLLPSNRYISSKNFTITKDGKIGVASSINGFKELADSINLNTQFVNRYYLNLSREIAIDEVILTYTSSGIPAKLVAISAITSLEELKTQIDTVFTSSIVTEIFNNELIVDILSDLSFDTFTAIINGTFNVNLDASITAGETIFQFTDGLTTTAVISASAVTNVTELELVIDSFFISGTFTYPNPGVTGDVNFFNFSNFHPSFTVNSLVNQSAVNIISSTVVTEINTNIVGMKEIPLSKDENLIMLFRSSDTKSYIQIIHYDYVTQSFLNSGYISSSEYASSNILEKNIIYEKLSNVQHSLYWINGSESDKTLTFTISIDPNDYTDWTEYINKLSSNVVTQAESLFTSLSDDFLPKPEFNSLNQESGGLLQTGEAVICFYRLINNNNVSNISMYSQESYVTYYASGITFDADSANSNNYVTYNEFDKLLQMQGVKFPTNQTKGFRILFDINGIDTDSFKEIEPYYIHYNKNGGEFVVRKGSSIPITSSITVEYNELYESSNLQTVSVEELIKLRNLFDTSTTQNIYRNRRVKANLKNSTNNILNSFDARAYRFNTLQKAALYSENSDIKFILDASGSTPTWSDVPEKHDAINSFNDEYSDFSDWKLNHQYRFKSDGTTVGGEGSNISYTFNNQKVETVTLDQTIYTNGLTKGVIQGNGGNRNPIALKGFSGGEVYRFFIAFWKGDTVTTSKWIGDIKFPDQPYVSFREDTTDNRTYSAYSYGIDFDVNTSNIKNDITAISIGFVPREEKDKTSIVTTYNMGLYYQRISGLEYLLMKATAAGVNGITGFNTFPATGDDDKLQKLLCLPINLENWGILNTFKTGEYFLKSIYTADTEFILRSTEQRNLWIPYVDTDVHGSVDTFSMPNQLTEILDISNVIDSRNIKNALGLTANVILQNKTLNAGATATFPAITESNDDKSHFSKTFMILNEYPYAAGINGIPDQLLFSVRRKVTNQYGGNLYLNRTKNNVELSTITPINGQDSITTSPTGDSYSCLADIRLANGYDGTNEHNRGGLLGIESSINVHNIDIPFDVTSGDLVNPIRGTFYNFSPTDEEITNVVERNRINKLEEELVYKNISTASFVINSNSIATLLISEKRTEGIDRDEWNTFLPFNEKIIDPDLGAVFGIAVYKDILIILQERGVAQQFIEQVQQQTDSIADIVLGTGDVAGSHEYIHKGIGIQAVTDFIQVNDDVVFRDFTTNKLYSITGGEIPGISNILKDDNLPNLPRKIIYDRDTNIALIPNYINYPTTSEIIIYDNNLKKITSDKSLVANTDLVFQGLNNLISFSNINRINIFNQSNYMYYPQENTDNDLNIKFVVNPDLTIVKTFDNLQLDYEVLEYDVDGNSSDVYNFTPESIRVQTQYQDTGVIAITTNNFRRRGRIWKFTIPRNQNNTDRLRDYYAIVTIKFPATSNREVKLNNVITSYGTSNLK